MSTPSTRRRLLLLSVVAVVAGIRPVATNPSDVTPDIQPLATAPSSPSPSIQPHENTTTLIASASKSRNEERIRSDVVHLIFPPKSFLWDKTQGMLPTVVSLLWAKAARNDLKHATNPAVLETAVKTLFDHYGVGAVTTKVFNSKRYRQWSNSILRCFNKDPLKGHQLMFNRLLLHYDQKLPEMLASAKRNPVTHQIAERFETIQIDRWIKNFQDNLHDLVESHEIQQWYKLEEDMNQYPAVALRAQLENLHISDWKYQLEDVPETSDAGSIVKGLIKVSFNLTLFKQKGLQYADDIEALLKSDVFKEWKREREGFDWDIPKYTSIGEELYLMIRGCFTSDDAMKSRLYRLPADLVEDRDEILKGAYYYQLALEKAKKKRASS